MGESEGKQTHKSALTTSSLDIAIDLKKPLAAFTRELPTNFGLRPDGKDPARAQVLQVTAPIQPDDVDQWHPVYEAYEWPGFPRHGSVGPLEYASGHPTKLNYYSQTKNGLLIFEKLDFLS